MSVGSFSDRIVAWYRQNRRDLPWRETRDPYRIWLSEIILQQTRVNQGMPYYLRFIEEYPAVADLAMASETQVLRTWQGLGYYSRARNLHKCARTVVQEYGGKFPDTYEGLIRLPGIGPYTASAIASFAFGRKEAVVDGNVFRVLARFFGSHTDISSGKGAKEFRDLARLLLPDRYTEDHNQGIMEFGAIQCTPGMPDCASCILSGDCAARNLGIQTELPVKLTKTRTVPVHFTYFVVECDGKIWMNERKSGIWQGLYDFLLAEEKLEAPENWLRENAGLEEPRIGNIVQREHVLSHRRIHASFVRIELRGGTEPAINKNGRFFDLQEIGSLPKPVLIEWYLNTQHGIE